MSARPVRFNVGLKRLSKKQPITVVKSTRQAREAFRMLERNLQSAIKILRQATPDALEYALDPIYERSQELVPRLTHTLAESGFVDTVRVGDRYVGEVGYAPGGVPHYSIFVHENLEATHESPTQAKFLEQAVKELSGKIPSRIVEFMRIS